jgi:hypothetical protein
MRRPVIVSVGVILAIGITPGSALAQSSPTPTPTPATHLESGAATLTLWLIVGFVLLGGVVAAFGRSLLEGSFKSRSGSMPDKGGAGRATPDRTFMRSWLALALVGGLLIFAAVSFQLDDTALRSSLLGGVIASAGAATAFYFASKSSDQARQDILNASFPRVTAPSLIGKTKTEVMPPWQEHRFI